MPEAGAICPDPQRISEARQINALPEAIRTTKEVSREYGEQHHFQQRAGGDSKIIGCPGAKNSVTLYLSFFSEGVRKGERGAHTGGRMDMCADLWKDRRTTSL